MVSFIPIAEQAQATPSNQPGLFAVVVQGRKLS